MSFVKFLLPICDLCHWSNADLQERFATIEEMRKILKSNGWIYKNKQDICPTCVKNINSN